MGLKEMKPWRAEVVFNDRLNSSAYALGLKPLEKIKKACPGQFYMLKVSRHPDPLLRRPFSHCRLINDGDFECLELIYEVKGKGTEILSRLEHGEVISLIGPLGKGFSFMDDKVQVIMVAGGMGVVPLFSLLDSLAEDARVKSIDFIWGVKTRENFFRLDELKGPGLKIHLVTEDGSYGQRGMATDILNQVFRECPDMPVQVFACGPKDMFKEIAELARGDKMLCQFSMEERMACGFGACLGCALPARSGGYLHVCKDGPVFDANQIDWNLI